MAEVMVGMAVDFDSRGAFWIGSGDTLFSCYFLGSFHFLRVVDFSCMNGSMRDEVLLVGLSLGGVDLEGSSSLLWLVISSKQSDINGLYESGRRCLRR